MGNETKLHGLTGKTDGRMTISSVIEVHKPSEDRITAIVKLETGTVINVTVNCALSSADADRILTELQEQSPLEDGHTYDL